MSSSTYSEYHVPEAAPPADLKAPCPPPLAAAPSGDFWNETQWKVLLSLLDAVVPSIVSESDVTNKFDQRKLSQSQYSAAAAKAQASVQMKPSDELLKAYLQERMLDKPAFVDNLKRTLDSLPPKTKNDLGGVLSLLSSRAGAFVLTGYCTPVQEQPIHVREAILQAWLKSWIGTLRGLGKSLTMVAHVAYLETSPLFKQITGYPDVPADWKAGRHFDYTFLQFPADPAPAVIETDVVVVGSGCGGAVVARTLAEAGHRVVVVDKGSYFPPSQLPMPQEEGSRYMYENQGFIVTEDGSLSAVAGGCWGGGGAVNWSVCLQTQGFVRREWARQHGLAWFETQDFQDALDRVCGLAGASEDGIRHPHRARVVLDGARRLGWHAKATPVNSAGEDHWCGHCHLGCGGAGKLSTVVSWLPAAAEAGARFIEGFLVDRVLFDDDGKKATGVVGTWTSRDGQGGVSGPLSERTTRRVEIRAKKVVLSAGSLWSPLILMKSGVKNRNLGRNLRLHPCNFVSACFEEETRPWEGGIITSVCTSFENLDGQGHGVKLEPTCMLPYAALSWVPWRSGLDFKLGALRYRHLANFISLTRDRDSGSVFPDPVTGRPRIDYTPSRFDAAHTLEGAVALAQMCYVAGATEIAVVLPGIEPFVRAAPPPQQKQAGNDDDDSSGSGGNLGVSDPAFEKWIAHVRKVGNRTPDAAFSSAHQMGTCRMSSHAGAGVVDPRGRVWGREALYVADASVFPSASGVNPMVTNMAIADHIARGIARELASGA